MRACACDTASRLCVRTVLCRSAFSLAPSLHGLHSGRGRFVRPLPRYFGQVRLLHCTHRRLRPPAFPTTSRSRLTGTAMETSRFPCKRLLRMPGSTTTRGRLVSCGIDTRRVAFCGTENISTPNLSYAAQYLACALPCERFTPAHHAAKASAASLDRRQALNAFTFPIWRVSLVRGVSILYCTRAVLAVVDPWRAPACLRLRPSIRRSPMHPQPRVVPVMPAPIIRISVSMSPLSGP
jgi:hypothetical protein